jgi:hypothetical protein
MTNGQFMWLSEFYYDNKYTKKNSALVKKLYNADVKELERQEFIVVYKYPGCYSVEITETGKAEVIRFETVN